MRSDHLAGAAVLVGIACALGVLYLLLEVVAPRPDQEVRR